MYRFSVKSRSKSDDHKLVSFDVKSHSFYRPITRPVIVQPYLSQEKATTIRTLTRRAKLVCDSPDSLQDETDYLTNVFSKNNYNKNFVRWNTHSNTDSIKVL